MHKSAKIKAGMAVAFGLLLAPFSAAYSQNSDLESNWNLDIRKDQFTDVTEGSASLADASGNRITFACNGLTEKFLSVQYIPRRYLGSSNNVVIIRFDDDPSLPSAAWEYTSKGAYTTSDPFVEFFSVNIGAAQRTIRVRALNYEDQPIDAVFISINGKKAINAIRVACGKQPI